MNPDLRNRFNSHVASDVMYPATCEQIVGACENMSDFSSEEKAWFAKALPHGMYKTPADVNRAVGI